MKFVMAPLVFAAGFAVGFAVTGVFALPVVVQCLVGAGLGGLLAQPVWSYYADRDARTAVHGLFGDVARDVEAPDGDAPAPAGAIQVEAARAIATDARPADRFSTRLRPVQCPSCGARYERRPETTFHGFQRFTCGECRMVLRGPLSWGDRALWWGSGLLVGGIAFMGRGEWHSSLLRAHPLWVLGITLLSLPVLVDLATLLFPRRRKTFLR